MPFTIIITGHNGIFQIEHPSLVTPFQAANIALRCAGTELDTGYITVEDVLEEFTTFEFLRVGDMLAIV